MRINAVYLTSSFTRTHVLDNSRNLSWSWAHQQYNWFDRFLFSLFLKKNHHIYSGRKLAPVCTERCTTEVGFLLIYFPLVDTPKRTHTTRMTDTVHNEALDIKGSSLHTCPNHSHWRLASQRFIIFLYIYQSSFHSSRFLCAASSDHKPTRFGNRDVDVMSRRVYNKILESNWRRHRVHRRTVVVAIIITSLLPSWNCFTQFPASLPYFDHSSFDSSTNSINYAASFI